MSSVAIEPSSTGNSTPGTRASKPGRTRYLRLLGALALTLVVGTLSAVARIEHHSRFQVPEQEGWVVADPDSLYHLRRVARVLEEGSPVAERDPFLNYPDGAAIPWPPYYTLVTAGAARLGLPDDAEARRIHIEERVTCLPAIFGVLTSVLVALAACSIGGPAAGAFAGCYHALAFGSIAYSRLGNADHHAWVSLLQTALIAVLVWGIRRGALHERRPALAFGVASGAIAGLLLGSWVGSLLAIVSFEAILAYLLFAQRRWDRSALATLGLAFHVTALAVIAPAIASSPWLEDTPWIVVNLSYYHVAHLITGALPFAIAMLVSHRNKQLPWLTTVGIALVGGLLFAFNIGPARGIREGFDWVSRSDTFMAGIAESRPLFGAGSIPLASVFHLLGYGVWLFPPALAWLAWRAFAGRERVLLPWFVAAGLGATQTMGQVRFADAFTAPMAVVLAWALFAWSRERGPVLRRLLLLLAFASAVGLQWPTVLPTWQLAASEGPVMRGAEHRRKRANRRMLEWLEKETHSPAHALEPQCVLANWNQGHGIEWVTRQPTVATNFGSYIGEDSYLDPTRFFMSHDSARAEQILVDRQARYVLLMSSFTNSLRGMLRSMPESERSQYSTSDGISGTLEDAWFETIGAALMHGGRPYASALGPKLDSLDFLRRVHVSPMQELQPTLKSLGAKVGMGWIYERVPGARIETDGVPGEHLTIALDLEYPGVENPLAFRRSSLVGADGIARMRVPYATEDTNGDGFVVGTPTWSIGARSGRLRIYADDVLNGNTCLLP
ncbi:MAG: asparagine N-glycosylation enzyme membrane subunit Stt3 [Planctomycetota bacterium]|jgi:asparagine N-glycosylation enzyme membrane subunit Stt3